MQGIQIEKDVGEQKKVTDAGMGNIVMIKGSGRLTASGVGSCLVITLYHPILKVGGLAHAMLPSSNQAGTGSEAVIESHMRRDAKYVDVAIDKMLEIMKEEGAGRHQIEAKIVGGASLFPSIGSDIGERNVRSAKEKLKAEGIALVGEVVGGSKGRSVEFCVATGIITVKTKV